MLQDDAANRQFYRIMLGESYEKVKEEGREEGYLEGARQNIELLVEKIVPGLLEWAKEQLGQITDLATLHTILCTICSAATEDEIKAAFSVSA